MEALVVSMLVSVTFLGLTGAIFTAVKASDVNRHRQLMEAALTSYGESVKAMPVYLECGVHAAQPNYGHDYDTGVRSSSGMAWVDPPDISLDITPQFEVMANDGSWSTICPLARTGLGTRDSGAQRLTIEVTSRGKTLTGEIVKTRPLS